MVGDSKELHQPVVSAPSTISVIYYKSVRTTAPPEVMTDLPIQKSATQQNQLTSPMDRIGEMAQQIYGEHTYG